VAKEATVAMIHMTKTDISTSQPPSLSVSAAPSSLPPRQTSETPESIAPTFCSKAGAKSGSTSTEVLIAGIITRPAWLTSTAEKSSHEHASKAILWTWVELDAMDLQNLQGLRTLR
jgi:hypothetical protein